MIYPLVAKTDPILSKGQDPFDFYNLPINPIDLANSLVETLKHNYGVGLSANQLGLPYRAFAMIGEPYFVCFNPKIVDHGKEEDYMKEGCLSYPHVLCKIKRHTAIKVRFTDPHGTVSTHKFAGITARIFQHELDHLDGINFLQQATQFHREQALNKAKILSRKAKKS